MNNLREISREELDSVEIEDITEEISEEDVREHYIDGVYLEVLSLFISKAIDDSSIYANTLDFKQITETAYKFAVQSYHTKSKFNPNEFQRFNSSSKCEQ